MWVCVVGEIREEVEMVRKWDGIVEEEIEKFER